MMWICLRSRMPTSMPLPSRLRQASAAAEAAITVSVSPDVSYAENDITNTTEAVIEGGSIVSTPGAVSLEATDNSTIKSDITAAAVSIGFTGGSAAISFSIAGTIGLNDIANETRAVVTEGSTIDAGTTVDLTAASSSTIEAVGVSASIAVSGSGGSVSVSGAGSALLSLITRLPARSRRASRTAAMLTRLGPLRFRQRIRSDIETTVVAASLAAGGSSSVAVNISLAAAVALNEFGTTTRAAIRRDLMSPPVVAMYLSRPFPTAQSPPMESLAVFLRAAQASCP